eukprot:scaffold7059_cov250-Pinguiococcus_pyrenoidosus.AAC.13
MPFVRNAPRRFLLRAMLMGQRFSIASLDESMASERLSSLIAGVRELRVREEARVATDASRAVEKATADHAAEERLLEMSRKVQRLCGDKRSLATALREREQQHLASLKAMRGKMEDLKAENARLRDQVSNGCSLERGLLGPDGSSSVIIVPCRCKRCRGEQRERLRWPSRRPR